MNTIPWCLPYSGVASPKKLALWIESMKLGIKSDRHYEHYHYEQI